MIYSNTSLEKQYIIYLELLQNHPPLYEPFQKHNGKETPIYHYQFLSKVSIIDVDGNISISILSRCYWYFTNDDVDIFVAYKKYQFITYID